MSEQMIRIERHGDDGEVAELVLDRPSAMNAISTDMARALADACAQLAADTGVRAVVVTSSHEKAFCVGADLKERNSFTDADLVRQRPIARAAYTGVLDLPMPVVAAVVFILASTVSVADNGLAFASVAEAAGPKWSGKALGTQNTGQFVMSAILGPGFGALITVFGFPLSFAFVAVAPLLSLGLIPKQDIDRIT